MMMLAPAYRRTILLALIAVLAVLGGVVAAPAAAQSDRSSELQQLVTDLDYQLKLVAQFDRLASDKRRAQLAAAIERWNDSPRGEADFQVMQQWLKRAIRASMPGLPKDAPHLPEFPQPELSEPELLETELLEPVAKSPAVEPDVEAKPQSPKTVAPKTVAPEPEAIASPSVALPKPGEAVKKSAPRALAKRVPQFKNVPRQTKPEAIAPPAPAKTFSPPVVKRSPRPENELGNPFVDDPIEPSPAAVAGTSPRGTASRGTASRGTASRGTASRGTAPATSPTPRVVMRPAGLSTSVSKSSQVRVNVAELGARVRGYVQGLRRVEAQLVASPRMSIEELLLVAQELQQLANQRGFVSLYLDGLAGDDSILPAELPTLEAAKAMVEAKLAEFDPQEGRDEPAISAQLFDDVFANPQQEFRAVAFETIQKLLAEL